MMDGKNYLFIGLMFGVILSVGGIIALFSTGKGTIVEEPLEVSSSQQSFSFFEKLNTTNETQTSNTTKINETILEDGSKFKRISESNIIIERERSVMNITSDIPIIERGNITKTKEWEYLEKGKHFELTISNKNLTIKGKDNLCSDDFKSYSNGDGSFTREYECNYYPPTNNRKFIRISDNIFNTTFIDEYDPLVVWWNETAFGQQHAVVGGFGGFDMDSDGDFECTRFNATTTGDVTNLAFDLNGGQGSPLIAVGVKNDSGGNPTGDFVAFINWTRTTNSEVILEVDKIGHIEEGTVYHFCWFCETCDGTNEIKPNTHGVESDGDREFFMPNGLIDKSFLREFGTDFGSPSTSANHNDFAINVSNEWIGIGSSREPNNRWVDVNEWIGQNFTSTVGDFNITTVEVRYNDGGIVNGILHAEIRNFTNNVIIRNCTLPNITIENPYSCSFSEPYIVTNETHYNLVLSCPLCGDGTDRWEVFFGNEDFDTQLLEHYWLLNGTAQSALRSTDNVTWSKTLTGDPGDYDLYFAFTGNRVDGEPAPPVNDSCTYFGGDWVIDCADNCVLTNDTIVSGNILINDTGSGGVIQHGNANISGFTNFTLLDPDNSNCNYTRTGTNAVLQSG